jgi:hypothetical protein
MLTELPPGLLKDGVCSFLDTNDIKNLHQVNHRLKADTTNTVGMTAADKTIWLMWQRLTEMDNDLSNLREQFHELKCTKKRVRYTPNNKFASVIYNKVIYGPFFETRGQNGSWLFFFLDEVVAFENSDLNVYKNDPSARTNRYQLDSSSPFVTTKDLEMFRRLYDDQMSLCDDVMALVVKYIYRPPAEIKKLRSKIEKVGRKYLR